MGRSIQPIYKQSVNWLKILFTYESNLVIITTLKQTTYPENTMECNLIDVLKTASVSCCDGDDIDSFWVSDHDNRLVLRIGNTCAPYYKTFPVDQKVTIDSDGFVHSFKYDGQIFEFSFYVYAPYIPVISGQ